MGKNFLDCDGLLYKRKPRTKTFTIPLERSEIKIDYYTDAELHAAKNEVLVFDLEIYPNYFLAAFQHYRTKKVVTFDLFPGREVFNYQKLLWVLHNFCIIGFNSLRFDLPLIWLAMTGATVDMIHDACMSIIVGNARARDIESQYGFKQSKINHIDLIEVAPLSASLKTYMGRLHAKRLQDLPYDPMEDLTGDQADHVKQYCVNDLDGTLLLLDDLNPQLCLRSSMGDQYGQDLRSKSDAQIAETVLCSEVAKLNGKWPKRPQIKQDYSFKYKVPEFIRYEHPDLKRMLELIRSSTFVLNPSGHVITPPEMQTIIKTKNREKTVNHIILKIGKATYKMGIGGLHSSEKSKCIIPDADSTLSEIDATSFYPAAIRGQELFPSHMGMNFLAAYGSIVDERIAAKKLVKQLENDESRKTELQIATTEMNSKKTVILSSFGKFGSKWSNLYAPDLMIQVTISGQLSLLMLIERIEAAGIPIVSGNTDGVDVLCPKNRRDDLKRIVTGWETECKFQAEETFYKALYKSNVNNYIALKPGGKIKQKGAFKKADLSKNPTNTICTEAALALLTHNTPIEETIHNCTDITKFVTLRNVRGGGEKDGVYLGKVVRWYYAEKEHGTINYVNSGNKVPKSDGAKPIMDLPDEFPTDINYERYVDETIAILYDIDYLKKPTQRKFFS